MNSVGRIRAVVGPPIVAFTRTQRHRDVVELRVHGVSGTPPEKLLEYPPELIDCLYGDKNAGFYRRRAQSSRGPDDSSASYEGEDDGEPTYQTEAFCWGGWTSGPATRALWLLFLPFIFINLAHWMLPPTHHKRSAAWSFRLLRLLGLTFSVTLLLTLVSVLVDIVGWQCAGTAQCANRLGPLTFLASWTPGARLAVTAVLVMAVAAVLQLMQKESPRIGRPPPDAAEATPNQSPLAQPHFWNGDRSVNRLRDCHLTVWFAVPAALVVAASIPSTGRPLAPPAIALLVLNIAFIGAGVGLTCCDRVTARGGAGLAKDLTDHPAQWPRWMWLSSLAVSIVSLGWVLVDGRHVTTADMPGPLPYLAIVTEPVIGLQIVLLALLTLTTWLSGRSSGPWQPGYRPTLKGLTAPCLAVLAWCISGEASVAVSFWVARLLGQPVESAHAADAFTRSRSENLHAAAQEVVALAGTGPRGSGADLSSKAFGDLVLGADGAAPLQLLDAAFIASVVNLVVVVLTALLALCVGLWTWRHARKQAAISKVWLDYGRAAAQIKNADAACEVASNPEQKLRKLVALMRIARVRAISSARAWSKLSDSAATIVAVVVVIAVLAVIAFVAASLAVVLARHGQLDLASWFARHATWTRFLAAGQAMSAFVAAVGLGLAYRAFRSSETRRRVAILWDVVTFWPHAAHPLGPPSYGERAVPDLWARVSLLATRSDVVIAAHSQGTVLAAAALLMDAGTVSGVESDDIASSDLAQHTDQPWLSHSLALLTFGAPLRRLYARNFPAYFGFPCLDELRTKLSVPTTPRLFVPMTPSERWVNLWALTDPIGGWIFNEDLGGALTEMPDGAVVDHRLRDAEGLLPLVEEGRYPPICGHSGFWTRPEYGWSVEALESRIAPAVSTEYPMPPMVRAELETPTPASAFDIAALLPLRFAGPGE